MKTVNFVFPSAPKGTEHLQVQFSEQKFDKHDPRDFKRAFVQAASKKARMLE